MEVLDYKQMASLYDRVSEKIKIELYIANRCGMLEETLKKYDFKEKKEDATPYYFQNSKILIIGSVTSNKNNIMKIFKDFGISPDRVDIVEDYEKLPGFNAEKLRYSTKYSDILACAMPHKMKKIGKYPDLISMIEDNQSEFPLLNKITTESGVLKFSMNGLKNAIMKTRIIKDAV